MMAFEKERCIDPNPNPNDDFCPAEYHLRDIVVIDLLSDQKYPDNVLHELNYNGDPVANPSFSPDGFKIVALKRSEGGWYYFGSLVVLDIANNNQWIVNSDDDPTLTNLYGSTPAWSPAGDQIAYYLNSQYDSVSKSMKFERDLFLIDPDTGSKTRLTNDDYNNTQPSWSPDGEKIVFSSDRDGEESMDIWVMDRNGSNLTKVVDCTPASCYSPSFSPDGEYIAFGNGGSIYTVLSDGNPYSRSEILNPGVLISSITWSDTLIPPDIKFSEPNPITVEGGSSTITWESSRATEVEIDGIAGTQAPSGSIVVSPESTTSYTFRAYGPTGSIAAIITVKVDVDPPIPFPLPSSE
jgi:TolB protein